MPAFWLAKRGAGRGAAKSAWLKGNTPNTSRAHKAAHQLMWKVMLMPFGKLKI
jgi:hypothetical protein